MYGDPSVLKMTFSPTSSSRRFAPFLKRNAVTIEGGVSGRWNQPIRELEAKQQSQALSCPCCQSKW